MPFLVPCATLGHSLQHASSRGGLARSLVDALSTLGVRELLILWLVPSLAALLHLGLDRSLSDLEKREWRRYFLLGGCAAALIYLCSADRHLPPDPSGERRHLRPQHE